MEIFKIQGLTYFYPERLKPALDNINISVNEGDFILIMGESGSGKSTLARVFNGIVPEFYGGKIKGDIKRNTNVGMVFQDPEMQMTMDNVEREVAFGLENKGTKKEIMFRKVMETLSFMNLWNVKDKKTFELSGGQKQKVAISSVIAMGNKLLVLDEPTSQLDPALAEDVLSIFKRINEELGYTIILVEQRTDRCFHMAERIWYMEEGRIVFDGKKDEFLKFNHTKKDTFLPPVVRLFKDAGYPYIPQNVKEGRRILNNRMDSKKVIDIPQNTDGIDNGIIWLNKLYYSYKNNIQALNNVNLRIPKSKIIGIMGETGCGKTTLLKNIAGVLKPAQGSIKVNGTVGYLSQNPNDYLFNDTVYKELSFTLKINNLKDTGQIDKLLKKLNLYKYRDTNPRDLSSGERQRVAIASVMISNPDIILLDEPTRGLDNIIKEDFKDLLKSFKREEKTIIIVTHDVEFVSDICDKVCLMFNGSPVQYGDKSEVLSSGLSYSSQVNKLFNGFVENVVTIDSAQKILKEVL